MNHPLLDGIGSDRVVTERGTFHVLTKPATGETALPIVWIHGNVSSSLFFQPQMLASRRESFAIDLRGFGSSDVLPVDARRGVRDFSDDVAQVCLALDVRRAHFVGWSMGGGVVQQLMLDHPDLVASATLISPVSPYGFGGTRLDGSLVTPDGAGTGGGGANPDFVARLTNGDRSDEAPTSPVQVYRGSYVAAGHSDDHEQIWLDAMLTTATGDDNYPGTAAASESWPGFAAGEQGVLNTMSPVWFNTSGIVDLAHKPAVLWVHGTADAIVGDESFFDLNTLGKHGVIPGWPGDDAAPPQPMVSQTRAVLDTYRERGGEYTELAWEGVGHSAHLERPDEFAAALDEFASGVEQG